MITTKHFWLLPLFFCCACAVHSPATARSRAALEKEFLQTTFDLKSNTDDINVQVLELLGGSEAIANPGEPYNHLDVIDLKSPTKGLILAGESSNMTFIYYGQGGIAWTQNLLLVTWSHEHEITWQCHYRLIGDHKEENIEGLKKDFSAYVRPIEGMCDD